MSDCRKLIAGLLVILAGCSTGPRQPPPDVNLMPEPEPVVAVKPPPLTNSAPVPSNVPTPLTNHVEHFVETWVPLDRWCESNGYGELRRTATDAGPSYSFVSTNGTMTVRIGAQIATWRGEEYYLGFAPQIIDGHPYVHSLDIHKNFLPLLNSPIQFKTGPVIVIDPGHGGTDTGTKSVFNGHFEKEYTLDLARRLQALLTADGWTVWVTRTNDYFLHATNRIAFAQQHKADLFVSLHFNSAYPDEEVTGLETYCLTPRGMPSNLDRGYKDDASLTFTNNNFDAENIRLAARLHRSVLKVNGHADRGVRRTRYPGVLKGQNRPAVLLEGGYLSNPAEARRIADPVYRQKLAAALAQALIEDSVPPPSVVNQSSATNHAPALANPVSTNATEDQNLHGGTK